LSAGGDHKPRLVSRGAIVTERVRKIGPDGFAFIPNRFLKDGFFSALSADEQRLYLLLVLGSNRAGVSFYHYDTLCALLSIGLEDYLAARNALIAKDLIAFDGTRFQVLSLPDKPPPPARPLTSPRDFELHDPATIRSLILNGAGGADDDPDR
jgi:hypothetical protein